MTIAGHVFDIQGKWCTCGKKFVDICDITQDDVGKSGWCHSGCGNQKEYDEVRAEVDRLWKAHLESGVD